MGRNIYIVRHGNTFDKGDTVTRVGARTDLALSQSGQAQADALGAHFREAGIGFTAAFTSPLKRTLQTASAIMDSQPSQPELQIADFLREIDYGPDENQPEERVVARIGQAALDAWEQEAIPPPGWQVDPAALQKNWANLFTQLDQADTDGSVLVVTSNGIARFAQLAAEMRGATACSDLKLKTGAYGLIHIGGGLVTLEGWNIRP